MDPRRTIQIGIRGSIYDPGEHDWARAQGIRVLYMEEFVARSPADVMAEAKEIVGRGPTYVSFDIDSIDPSMAPGTGTPEVGGLASWQMQAVLRRLGGVRFVGMDVVEVAPAYDVAEITALAAATVVWEYLALAGAMR